MYNTKNADWMNDHYSEQELAEIEECRVHCAVESGEPWVGVDLDGTIAEYHGWTGDAFHIGEPIGPMVIRVKKWLEKGIKVKIFTARISHSDIAHRAMTIEAIHQWLFKLGLPPLEVTCIKDFHMLEVWDDRAVQVEPNTGRVLGKSTRGL